VSAVAPVLCIDADAHTGHMVRGAVAPSGHDVVEAASGHCGIEAALRERPALILVDRRLPDLDGLRVLHILRGFAGLAGVPVVVLSDGGPVGDGDGCIAKPIDGARLSAHIAPLLRRMRQSPTPVWACRAHEEFVGDLIAQRAAGEAERQRKDEFLAVLAHELRTPLTAIVAAMALLPPGALESPAVRQARDVVERQVRFQGALLDDLLDLTRIERHKIQMRFDVVDIRSVVAAALEVACPAIKQHDHSVSVSLPQLPLLVTADAIRLQQVVVNLLINATKYTPSGGRITLTVDADRDERVIRVRDTGAGIAPEMLGRVFESFVQLNPGDGAPRSAGLGIGLALAKRLVELHGGAIEARSAGRNCGSEFVVRLPNVA
jgi:signal transduction histidine kinase